jgi:hypothetical protein
VGGLTEEEHQDYPGDYEAMVSQGMMVVALTLPAWPL